MKPFKPRFQRPGMKWDADNAAALMNLTALREGAQWEQHWKTRKSPDAKFLATPVLIGEFH
jgi:hypothetical protein